jgi:Cu(I)/Ag(I) efflux system membrane fusion protein
MSRRAILLCVLFALLMALTLGLGIGYWAASKPAPATPTTTTQHTESPAEKKPLFYRHPMDPTITSPLPTKDSMDMDYVPVYAEEPPPVIHIPVPKAPAVHPADSTAEKPTEKKPLFYRAPMDPSVTSPVPAKDDMGMDYLPVYAEEAPPTAKHVVQTAPGLVWIAPEKVQRLGVRYALVERKTLARTVRAAATIEADERRLHEVTLRFDGYLETLHVNTTGQAVAQGQALFEVYSPDLVAAQREYLIARQGRTALAQGGLVAQETAAGLARGGLERLAALGVAEEELQGLVRTGRVRRTLVIRSPATGVVLEKRVLAGQKAMAGEPLYRIADLARVWAMAEVHEQDLGLIRLSQPARLHLDPYPGKVFTGRVDFIAPALDPALRTVKIRIELPNPEGLLKPKMYAHMEIDPPAFEAVIVPRSALLDSGRRTVVLVAHPGDRFEPRPVQAGLRGDEEVEILAGLAPGEEILIGANFLIDAESNLKAALRAFGPTPAALAPAPHEGHGPGAVTEGHPRTQGGASEEAPTTKDPAPASEEER